MKLLVVCQYYFPENFVVTRIAESLVAKGHDVTVLTGKPNYCFEKILPEYKKIKQEEINGVHVKRVKIIARKKSRLSIILNYLSFWVTSKHYVRHTKEKYDAVYSMSLSPVTILAAGNLYKKKHHVPHIVHCVDLWPESTVITHAIRKKSLAYKIIYKWSRDLYKHADKVLIGSPSFKEYFINELKLENLQLEYVPQCSLIESCDIKPFQYNEGFNILYCGNLGLIQKIELIPEVMSIINEKVTFHIIGMGPLKNKLLENIKKYHVEDKVIYHGAIPGKVSSSYFVNADAIYVSLLGDGPVGKTIPNKLEMAMCFRRPILGALYGDGRDALIAANGGIVADLDTTSIANGIKELITCSKKELNNFGINNKKYYQNNFSINVISTKIDKVLKGFQ